MRQILSLTVVCVLALVSLQASETTRPVRADVTDGSGFSDAITAIAISSFDQSVQSAYPVHPGYPIHYDEWTERASVTIADIHNDGSAELLLPTYQGRIHAWSTSGKVLPGFPIDNPGWQIRGRLALGDLNNDGDLEIVAGLESPNNGVAPKIGVWQSDGNMLAGWPQTTACARSNLSCSVASIVLADLDKDGNLEVIAGTTNRILDTSNPSEYVPNLYVWKANGGTAAGSWPNEDDHNVAIIGHLAVGDLDGDYYPDIVTGRDYNRLFAVNRLGANLNGWPHYVWYPYDSNDWTDDQIEFPRSAPALADLDRDGNLEYIIPGHRRPADSGVYNNNELLVYNKDGTRFTGWELPASGSSFVSTNTTRMIEAPAIADLTGDKKPEIILTTQDGYIRAYTGSKSVLWAFDYAQGKEIHSSEPVVGDLDGDGFFEVIFGTFAVNLDGTGPVGVYILDHTGKLKPGSPYVMKSPGVSSSPALGDLDGDGLIELAAATYNGWVYVWDTPGSAAPENLPWPMPRHDLRRTGQYVDTEPDVSLSVKTSSNQIAKLGDVITYTIRLVNTGSDLAEALQIDDTVPAGLSYIPGSLRASIGEVNEQQAPKLRWTGYMTDTTQIEIQYAVRVNRSTAGVVTNTAVLDAGSVGQYSLRASLFVNVKSTFLPLINR